MVEVKENTFICIEDNAIPNNLCDQIVASFEASEGTVAGRVVNADGQHVINEQAKVSVDLDFSREVGKDSEMDQSLFGLVNKAFHSYVEKFGVLKAFSVYDTGYFLTRYEKGKGFYDWHIDAGNEATINRLFSCLIYLNDVEEGGETEFFYQKLAIKPAKGRLVLFPAAWTHLHRGVVPVSGDKYILTTFLTHKISSSMNLKELEEKPSA